MIQSSQQVQLYDSIKPAETAAELDSDEFGDEAGDETDGLIESCTLA